jgi:uncharacterized protein (DUF1330 family)
MPKGYWIANNLVHDPKVYESYKSANAEVFRRHGARFLVRAGEQVVVEGEARPRTVVLEFPSYEAALACYEDPAYKAAKDVRARASVSTLIIVEGYEG